MIKALQAIDRWVNRAQFEYSTQDALATMKISGNTSGFMHCWRPILRSRSVAGAGTSLTEGSPYNADL